MPNRQISYPQDELDKMRYIKEYGHAIIERANNPFIAMAQYYKQAE
ncbi:hypothetical protein SDC9_189614 [bioreactor metagenome]|uniref:Uncharacterized protein n=1 Tax=bioreactor metagenome TaxID=1076179 RepID=A0A645HSN2_9ZZZZ